MDIESAGGNDPLDRRLRLTEIKCHAFIRFGYGEGLCNLPRQQRQFFGAKRRNQRRLALQLFL